MSRGQSSRGESLQDQRPPPSVTPAQPGRTVHVKNSHSPTRTMSCAYKVVGRLVFLTRQSVLFKRMLILLHRFYNTIL